ERCAHLNPTGLCLTERCAHLNPTGLCLWQLLEVFKRVPKIRTDNLAILCCSHDSLCMSLVCVCVCVCGCVCVLWCWFLGGARAHKYRALVVELAQFERGGAGKLSAEALQAVEFAAAELVQ